MKTWKLVAGVMLVLLVGILVGSLGTQMLVRHRFPLPPPRPGPHAAFLAEKFSRNLGLTQDQKARVKQILDQTNEKLHQHFREEQPQLKKIVDDGFSEIAKELSDTQREKFDHMRQRLERER
jgi:Spy/CpxP family protein refolding chaperone